MSGETFENTFLAISERPNYRDMRIVEIAIQQQLMRFPPETRESPQVAEFYQGEKDDLFVLSFISKSKNRDIQPIYFDYEIFPIDGDVVREKIISCQRYFSVLTTEFKNANVTQSFGRSLSEIAELKNISFFIFKNPIPKESASLFNIAILTKMLEKSKKWIAIFVHSDSNIKLNIGYMDEITGTKWTVYFNRV